MIDFEQDKVKKNEYFDVERLLGEVFNIRTEIITSLQNKYYRDIVAIQRKSELIRSVNSLLKYLVANQIDGMEADFDRINQNIKHLKRMNDEIKPLKKIEELINKLKWNTRDNK